MRNVRVLAIGQEIENKDGEKVATGKTATLELTPPQAETLALAQSMGEISLSLRSLADSTPGHAETTAKIGDSNSSSVKILEIRRSLAQLRHQLRSRTGRITKKGKRMRRFSVKSQAGLAVVWPLGSRLLGVIAPSPASADQQHRSYLRIADTQRAVAPNELGLNKSMIMELPRDVREVMVSNPDKSRRCCRPRRRAYLIGRAAGEANIIFVDKDGRQIASLEVTIERDFAALSEFIGRLIPGAHVKVDALNGYVVLTGTVQNPIDATRAGEIATHLCRPRRRRQP